MDGHKSIQADSTIHVLCPVLYCLPEQSLITGSYKQGEKEILKEKKCLIFSSACIFFLRHLFQDLVNLEKINGTNKKKP